MATHLKMALVFAMVLAALAHGRRRRLDRDARISDGSSELDGLARRSWQYEGIPIETMLRVRRNQPETDGTERPVTDAPPTPTTTEEATEPETQPEPTTTRKKKTTTKSETTRRKKTPIESATTRKKTTITTTELSTPLLPPLNKRYRRIYNPDENADIGKHPYLAAILMGNELWCGGAIIGTDLVLTAAHCLQLQYTNRFFREYVKMVTVRVGSSNATSGGWLLHVDEIFFHPNYKADSLAFNYAVLRLDRNITRDDINASVIEYSKRRDVPVDKTVTFLGWGSVLGRGGKGGAVLLQKVDLPVYDKADCAEIYGRDLMTPSTFCAGYITKMKNVCNHDAGGPAVMDGQLVGILSFSSKRCDQPDKPAAFSGTGVAAEWLDSIPEMRRKNDDLHKDWIDSD